MSRMPIFFLCLAALVSSGVGHAQTRPPHGPPPQAALDACQGKSDGAACTVTLHGHTAEGACGAPQGKPLACRPNGPPPPPPEALEACENLSAGAACSFTLGEEQITGSCRAPQGKPLACAPGDHAPPR